MASFNIETELNLLKAKRAKWLEIQDAIYSLGTPWWDDFNNMIEQELEEIQNRIYKLLN